MVYLNNIIFVSSMSSLFCRPARPCMAWNMTPRPRFLRKAPRKAGELQERGVSKKLFRFRNYNFFPREIGCPSNYYYESIFCCSVAHYKNILSGTNLFICNWHGQIQTLRWCRVFFWSEFIKNSLRLPSPPSPHPPDNITSLR